MTDVVRSTMATELASLQRVTDTPRAPFGYGADISCASDIAADMAEVSGRLVLAQALIRRLDCPRGALPDDAAYGIDLRSYCNRGVTADEVRALAGQVRNELEKDDRVDRASVVVRPSATAQTLAIEIAITAVDPDVEAFTLTLSVSSAAVLLEELRIR